MASAPPLPTEADELLLLDEDAPCAEPSGPAPWRLLVVDDEPSVLEVTQMVLGQHQCGGRPLSLTLAQSAAEARSILAQDPDYALALVDVVMETENAGLDLVDHIRHDLHLDALRIIVRTGQPGLMNKQTVLSRWGVDDFWLKTEQNATTLRQSICAALRPPNTPHPPCHA
ncbi:response regulator [Inhella crocodyli]|nr:response regulator [Inhella crocodyli]